MCVSLMFTSRSHTSTCRRWPQFTRAKKREKREKNDEINWQQIKLIVRKRKQKCLHINSRKQREFIQIALYVFLGPHEDYTCQKFGVAHFSASKFELSHMFPGTGGTNTRVHNDPHPLSQFYSNSIDDTHSELG